MKKHVSAWLCILLSFFTIVLHAQTITINWPVSRMVFQRSANNEAIIPVRGRVEANTTRLLGRLIARQGGQTTDWREASLQNGSFQVNIPAKGGFYDLELVALNGIDELQRQRRERIGVGEVFIIAGQSNNYGEPGKQLAATDDRVSVLNHWPGHDGNLDEQSMPMNFAQAGSGTFCGPRNPLFIWGGLGDRLVAQLGVPVLFLGAAHPGSSTKNWREAAQGLERVTGRDWNNNLPYRPLRLTLQHYARHLGVRSVLWHQGESDNKYQTADGYAQNMRILINKTREDSQLPNLSWTIARASYYPFYLGHERDPNVIEGQNRTIQTINNAFPGPETDAFTGPAYREDRIHFAEYAYGFLADLWNQSLNTDYFQRSQPSLPSLGSPSPVAQLPGSGISLANVPGLSTVTFPAEVAIGNSALQLAEPGYNCQTGAITFRAATENGSGSVEYMVPGVTIWTTNPTHTLGAGIRRDAEKLTIFARQGGQQTSLVWNLRAFCQNPVSSPQPEPIQIVNTPTPSAPTTSPEPMQGLFVLLNPRYNCQTGVITFVATPGNGSLVEYMAPGVTIWTANPTHTLGEGLRRDARSLTIFARQGGQQTSLVYSLRDACAQSGRVALERSNLATDRLPMPNPATDYVRLEWPEILNVNWTSRLLDMAGLEMPVQTTATPTGLQLDIRTVRLGMYIWQVIPPGRPAQSFRVMKVD